MDESINRRRMFKGHDADTKVGSLFVVTRPFGRFVIGSSMYNIIDRPENFKLTDIDENLVTTFCTGPKTPYQAKYSKAAGVNDVLIYAGIFCYLSSDVGCYDDYGYQFIDKHSNVIFNGTDPRRFAERGDFVEFNCEEEKMTNG